jgi:hypothetical protein
MWSMQAGAAQCWYLVHCHIRMLFSRKYAGVNGVISANGSRKGYCLSIRSCVKTIVHWRDIPNRRMIPLQSDPTSFHLVSHCYLHSWISVLDCTDSALIAIDDTSEEEEDEVEERDHSDTKEFGKQILIMRRLRKAIDHVVLMWNKNYFPDDYLEMKRER